MGCTDSANWLAALQVIAARNPITALPPHQTLHASTLDQANGPTTTEGWSHRGYSIAEPLVTRSRARSWRTLLILFAANESTSPSHRACN